MAFVADQCDALMTTERSSECCTLHYTDYNQYFQLSRCGIEFLYSGKLHTECLKTANPSVGDPVCRRLARGLGLRSVAVTSHVLSSDLASLVTTCYPHRRVSTRDAVWGNKKRIIVLTLYNLHVLLTFADFYKVQTKKPRAGVLSGTLEWIETRNIRLHFLTFH